MTNLPMPSTLDAEAAIAEMYRAHYALLAALAGRKFHVPDADVPDLIHEVVLDFIRARARIANERAWLIGAVCNAARMYWRTQTRTRSALDATAAAAVPAHAPVDIALQLDVATMLRRLPGRCRDVLRRRFIEGYSADELARAYDTTAAYARKMVYRCVAAARDLLARDVRRGRP